MAKAITYLVMQGQDAPVWPSTPLLLSRGDMVVATAAQVDAWHNPKPRVEDDDEEVVAAPVPVVAVDYLAITDKSVLADLAKQKGVKIPQGSTLVAMQNLLKEAA